MKILKIVGIIVAVLIVIAIAVPVLIDANTFRPKLESELTEALGRQVKVGNLSLSLFSGSVAADNISIADDPQINLIKSENGEKWNFSSLGGKNTSAPKETQSSGNPNLSVAKLNVNNGKLTVSQIGEGTRRVYDKVNITVTNFSFTSSFPFQMTANLPSGGTMKLDGHAGPINDENAALTPVDAKINVQNMNLATSGFIDPAAGIAGIANLDGTLKSNGQQAKVAGTLKATSLQVVKKGSPAGRPVDVKFALVHNLVKETGDIT